MSRRRPPDRDLRAWDDLGRMADDGCPHEPPPLATARDEALRAWCRTVWTEVLRMSEGGHAQGSGMVFDVAVGYRLGLGPGDVAAALVGRSPRTLDRLVRASFGRDG
jgi:hypothetical protein